MNRITFASFAAFGALSCWDYAQAACPGTLTDCPSPSYNSVNAQGITANTVSGATIAATMLSGTFSGVLGNTGVTAGTYPFAAVTVRSDGRVASIASGASGLTSVGITPATGSRLAVSGSPLASNGNLTLGTADGNPLVTWASSGATASGLVFSVNASGMQLASAPFVLTTSGLLPPGGVMSLGNPANAWTSGYIGCAVIGAPSGGCVPGALNAQTIMANGSGTVVSMSGGTGISVAPTTGVVTVTSRAIEHLSYQPGLLTAISSIKSVFYKVGNASTVDNIEGSASIYACVSTPMLAFWNCGSQVTCGSPVLIGLVSVSGTAGATDGTIVSGAIAAGTYIAATMASGTCTSIDLAGTMQIHAN